MNHELPHNELVKRKRWFQLHPATYVCLIPVLFFWIVVLVPGERNSILFEPNFQNGAFIKNSQMFVEDECRTHGWPFVHLDVLTLQKFAANQLPPEKRSLDEYIPVDSIPDRYKPLELEFRSADTFPPRSNRAPWMDSANWSFSGDWYYFHWKSILANITLAGLSFLLVVIVIETYRRNFGFQLSLFQLFVLFLVAVVLLGLTCNRFARNRYAYNLIKNDQRFVFEGVSISTPTLVHRIAGETLDVMFMDYTGINVIWDSTLGTRWWRGALAFDGTQGVCVRTKFGEPDTAKIPEEFFVRLGELDSLQELYLIDSEFESEHLGLLPKSKNLKLLKINHCELKPEAIELIAKIRSLKKVNLTGTQLSVEKIGKLRAKRPDLDITN